MPNLDALATDNIPRSTSSVVGRQMVHACYNRQVAGGGDVVVIKERLYHDDGRITPALQYVRNPKRSFYLTKPGLRTHEEKRECAPIQELDEYIVYNHELERELFYRLNGYHCGKRTPRLRELCNSPYVYGADISIESLIKAKYRRDFTRANLVPVAPTIGFADTEASILPHNRNKTTIISVTHETSVYTAVLRDVLCRVDKDGKRHPATIDDIKAVNESVLGDLNKEHGFTYEYYVGEQPIDLLRWIMSKVHANMTDFLGVWNLNYDMKAFLEICRDAEVDPKDIFSHPDVPEEYRYFRYAEEVSRAKKDDKKKGTKDWSRLWHWTHSTSATQFIDSMSLYSILRTVSGKEDSYALDDVLKSQGLGGKLTFKDDIPDADLMSKADWHRHMQMFKPLEYIVYNQYDVLSLYLLNRKAPDIASMLGLIDMSPLSEYTHQTRRAADTLYNNWKEKGYILASAGTNMIGKYDHLILKVGGAVLRPERMDVAGFNVFADIPWLTNMLHAFVNDVDFSGMYPTLCIASNISKETKLSTLIAIEWSDPVQTSRFFSHLVSVPENSVRIGVEYFGLKSYSDMEADFDAFVAANPHVLNSTNDQDISTQSRLSA